MARAHTQGRRRNWQALLRLICTFALCALAFAHTPIEGRASGIPLSEMAAYTLPDGSVPVLCQASAGHDEHRRHPGVGPNTCDVCRLSAAVLLPDPPLVGTASATLPVRVPLPTRWNTHARHLFPPNAAPRAPPFAAV